MTTLADMADEAALYGVSVARRPPRERVDRYVGEALERLAVGDERLRGAVETLVAAALWGPHGVVQRNGMVRYDANPLLLSHKTGSNAGASLRLQADLGLASLSAEEHLDHATATVRHIIECLEWQHLGSCADSWMRRAFQAQPDNDARTLHVGLVVEDESTELRLYCNPGGLPHARWECLAALTSLFGGASVAQEIGNIAAPLGENGAPVVIALCLRAGAVAGIRPYVKAKDWDGGRLAELLAFGGIGFESPIRSLAAYFSQWRDEGAGGLLFAGAAPCVAFDFPVSNGIVGLRPTRTKIDVPFRGLPGYPHGESSDVRARIAQLYAEVGLCAQGAIGFLDDLDHRFGGSRVEYLSAGSGQRGPEMTLYAVAAGLASQYRL